MLVIAISGVPGVGKTTISKILAKKLNAIHIDLSEFVKNHKEFIIEYDEAFQTYIIDEDKVINYLTEYIKNKPGNYILDGHFSHLFPKEIVNYYFVLRIDPNELYRRLKERGYPEHKIFENIWAMNLEVIEDELESEGKEYYVINVTKRRPEEIVNEILKIIKIKA